MGTSIPQIVQQNNPPALVIRLPNREPFIVWNYTEALGLLYQCMDAIKVFPEHHKS